MAPVRIVANKILLKSGTACAFNEGNCLDAEDGYTYWQPYPPSPRKFDQYDVLYEGIATKIQEIKKQQITITIELCFDNLRDNLCTNQTGEQPLCGYTLLTTEHSKLFC